MNKLKIERDEIRFVLLWTTVILGLSSIPYICGYLLEPSNMDYMWMVYYIDDQNPYLSWMRQAEQGDLFFQNMYTPEEHQPHLIFVYFLILGVLAKAFHLPLILIYHAARVVNSILLLLILYYLISLLLKEKRQRKLAFLLAGLGSGFGWVVVIIGSIMRFSHLTIDLWVPDAILFTSIMMSPLYTAAIFLVLLTFIMVIKGNMSGRIIYFILAGTICFVLALVHPYDVVTIYSVSLAFLAASYLKHPTSFYKKLGSYLILVAISIPPMIYNLYIFSTDPVLQGWKEQISEQTGHPLSVVLGFGIIFLLALAGFKGITKLKDKDDAYLFLVTWVVTSFILIFSPLQIQRRLLLGLQIPLSILAASALFMVVLPAIKNSNFLSKILDRQGDNNRWETIKRGIIITVFVLAIPTNLYVMGRIINHQIFKGTGYLKKDDLEALSWLKNNSRPGDVVLSDYAIGNYIPRVSGNRVVLGYHQLTLNHLEKVKSVNKFFKKTTEGRERFRILNDYGIRYIYYGKREKRLGELEYSLGGEPRDMVSTGGAKVDLYQEPYLKEVFRNSVVTIFRVIM